MLARLDELARRHGDVLDLMNQPEIAKNPTKIVEFSKEEGALRRLVEPYRAYQKVHVQIEEAQAILDDPQADAELKDLAREELPELEAKAAEGMEELKGLIVMGDDAGIDSIIMEIRAGTGGEEAALFARDLYEMYLRFAATKGYKHEILDASPTDMGGFREVIINFKGPGVYANLGYEAGGHRVQRVPDTEAQGRIHTSAATVAVLPEPKEIEVEIDWEKDVIEHVSRAGGPGGQNVNKVSSAIKLEHLPTGITVSMRDEKSQHKNRAKARRILMSRVYEMHMTKERAERDSARKNMIGSGDRSERIRTYNFPQNRCSDHRIGQNFSLDHVIQGEMADLIEALRTHDKEQRLKNLQLQ
ncbi:MAG: peptide chain release factor 1 [Phycisphaerae bacterium]|nr:peptide chain release factor 1 [Phycisphaerae bacterium]